MLNFDAKAKAQLKVLSKPQETAVTLPVVVGPDTKVIKRCFCIKNGRYDVIGRRSKRLWGGVIVCLSYDVGARGSVF